MVEFQRLPRRRDIGDHISVKRLHDQPRQRHVCPVGRIEGPAENQQPFAPAQVHVLSVYRKARRHEVGGDVSHGAV